VIVRKYIKIYVFNIRKQNSLNFYVFDNSTSRLFVSARDIKIVLHVIAAPLTYERY
jgi:hypothetical protein